MSIEAWPFLVSRNATFDYRVVVAPQYMIDNKASSLLAKAAGGDVTKPMSAICREVSHPNPEVGDSTLIFRIVEANNEHIGLEGNEALKDHYGRTIRLIEGFVVRRQLADSDEIVVTEDDLLDAHRSMQKDYQTFWYETDSTPPVRHSMPLDLPLDDLSRKSASEKVLKLDSVPAYTVRLKVSAPLTQPVSASSQTRNSSQQTSLPSTSTKTKEQWIDEGDLLAAGNFYEEALHAYDQALQLLSIDSHDNAPVYRGIGDVFYYQQSYEKADQAYNQALECDNKYAQAYNGKGLISSYR
jgi:tetratricopeptide (TPR) repeat protein